MIKFYDFCRCWLYLLALLSMVHAGSAYASDPVYSTIPAVDCVINPYRVADIASPVAGVIEDLLVTRSQQVRKGQPVAQLNADVERANVELANYRADIRSEIELGRINVSFDASRKDRFDSLYKEQVVSMDDIDAVKRESRLSRWRLERRDDGFLLQLLLGTLQSQ